MTNQTLRIQVRIFDASGELIHSKDSTIGGTRNPSTVEVVGYVDFAMQWITKQLQAIL